MSGLNDQILSHGLGRLVHEVLLLSILVLARLLEIIILEDTGGARSFARSRFQWKIKIHVCDTGP